MMMMIRTVTTHLIFMSYQKGRLLSAKQSLPQKKTKTKMENMNKTLQYVHVQHLKMTTQTGRMLVA